MKHTKMGKPKRTADARESAASSLKIYSEDSGEPPGLSARSLSTHEKLIRSLSDRLVAAQRPLRILDAIKWDDEIERAFFAAGCRELPPVTRDYYLSRPLSFDPEKKRQEFRDLERDIRRRLGRHHTASQIMARRCAEYRQVLDLLVNRGIPAFGALSKRLYGSSADRFPTGGVNLVNLGRTLAAPLADLAHEEPLDAAEPLLDAREAVRLLSTRLAEFFPDSSAVRVRLSDRLAADAAARGDCIKLRKDARFTPREVRLLEVHEGWVHLGTTRNGQRQPICTFLGKGPPSATITQEGLAVLTEVLSFASYPARVRCLAHRIEGIARAESGADFLDVYRFFLEEGYEPRASYRHTMRLFRGSLPAGCGPFTKDLCYSKGFVQLYNFLRLAATRGMMRRVSLLFCGKTSLDDMETLALLAEEGLLSPPRYVPPPFANLHALAAWLYYANFFASLPPRRNHDRDYD